MVVTENDSKILIDQCKNFILIHVYYKIHTGESYYERKEQMHRGKSTFIRGEKRRNSGRRSSRGK